MIIAVEIWQSGRVQENRRREGTQFDWCQVPFGPVCHWGRGSGEFQAEDSETSDSVTGFCFDIFLLYHTAQEGNNEAYICGTSLPWRGAKMRPLSQPIYGR